MLTYIAVKIINFNLNWPYNGYVSKFSLYTLNFSLNFFLGFKNPVYFYTLKTARQPFKGVKTA